MSEDDYWYEEASRLERALEEIRDHKPLLTMGGSGRYYHPYLYVKDLARVALDA